MKATSICKTSAMMAAHAIVGCVALLLAAAPVAAQEVVGPGNYCVQDNLDVSKLNCTANDTRLAGVKEVDGVPQISPTECTTDEDFLLSGIFLVETNATARYDLSVTFSSDGDPNGDGARTGQCSRGLIPIPPGEDFDGDDCGDVQSGVTYELEVTDLTVKCVDTDGDEYVNLPYIIGWAQNAQSLCENAAQALPGTTSKCEINDTFNIPVRVESPDNDLTKSAQVDVTYSILLTNNATTLTLSLDSLADSEYGDLLNPTAAIHDTNCDTQSTSIPPSGSLSCWFTVRFDKDHPGSADAVENYVTAEGTASDGVHTPEPFSTDSNSKLVTVHIEDPTP